MLRKSFAGNVSRVRKKALIRNATFGAARVTDIFQDKFTGDFGLEMKK
jgi:hypothetical protein